MKKLLLVLITILPSILILGQTTKGKFILSAGTGVQFTGSNVKSVVDGKTQRESDKVNSFSFMPTFGYFVIDNLAVGLSSNISTTTYKYSTGDKYISNSTLIMPIAMYYFPMDGKIRPLVQIGVGYSSIRVNYVPKTFNNSKETYSGPAYNFGGGVSYFISEDISFNFGLSYTKSTLTKSTQNEFKQKRGDFGSNIGISIFF